MSRPLRVAFVVHVMQVAGAEMLVAETVRRLGNRLRPTVFCLDAVGPLGEELAARGVPVVALGRRPGIDLALPRRLARELAEREIEVVHAHQYTPFFYTALARLFPRVGVRLILTEHGRHFPDVVSAKRRWANRLVLDRLADAVNACSSWSARALSEVDGFAAERVEVIGNGIDLGRYVAAPERAAALARLGLDPVRRYVAQVARFHPVKDHATALRAFAQVARERPDVDLLLVGDGPLRSELETQVRELGIEGRVGFLGVRSDVPEILGAVDLFLLSSVSEAASLTLLEAMASERPVVVTAVGGNPEIVRDGVEGILVPREDAEAMAAAILRLLAAPQEARALGRAGRRRVEERYRIEDTVERYYELYRRLAGV